MKDNFDLRQYLAENKLTEYTRGRIRKHFGKTVLNENLKWNDFDSDDRQDDLNENEEEYDRLVNKYGEKAARRIMEKFYSTEDDYPGELDEVGYIEDDDFEDDDDYIGARGSNREIGISTDKKAAAAAKRGMKDFGGFEDTEDEEEEDDFVDPEDLDADDEDSGAQPGETSSSEINVDKILGKNAPYVEILVDDLGQYLKGPKGKWRVNVSSNLLRRAIDSVRDYMDEYDFPKRGFLLAPNKAGGYDEIPVTGNNTLSNTPKAVVYVHREPIN